MSTYPTPSRPACLNRRWRPRTPHREPLDSPGIRRHMQEHYERRVERDFSGYDYELAQCEHCGLAYQAQVPTPELLQEIYAKMAGAIGVNVCGAALSQVRIDYAKSVGIPVVDANELPDGEFHFINTEQVFEHLLEPGELLRRLGRALRPGGLVKVSVPNSAKLYNSSSGWMEPKSALKTLARPVYRHLYPKSTFVYFARPA